MRKSPWQRGTILRESMMEFRWRRPVIAGEAAVVTLGLGIPGTITTLFLSPAAALALWGLVVAAALAVLLAFRWSSRCVVDPEGISVFRAGRRLRFRVAWDEILETHVGYREFRVRGKSVSFRVTAAYEDHEHLIKTIQRRSKDAIHDRLSRTYRERGCVEFSGPWPLLRAHLVYLVLLTLMAMVSAFVLHTLWKRQGPIAVGGTLLHGAVWTYFLWQARSAVSWLAGSVTMKPCGLTLRRLDGERRIGWEDVVGTAWSRGNGLEIRLCAGKPARIPVTIGNVVFLKRLIEERLRGPSPGQSPLSAAS